jgi:alginate O-acetyltransferase complex protein AlgI
VGGETGVVFNSLTFVVFFACVLGLHSLPLRWTTRKINLLIASYLFYAAWNPPFLILLWVSTIVDWYAAQGLVKARRESARHAWMLLSVIANLGLLGYFKYGQFLLDNFSALMSTVGIDYHPAHYDTAAPCDGRTAAFRPRANDTRPVQQDRVGRQLLVECRRACLRQ